jgi:predicted AlkP superfamily pyrophosphatase or phosphodiesterase
MKIILTFFCILLHLTFAGAASNPDQKPPKLIVGIVVDQMRYDYLTRYWNKFGDDGFKKLVREGFNCSNTHYSYVPTYTGPGHASIYTGTTPSTHGIISNNWYNRELAKLIYVTDDSTVTGVGTSGIAGKMSPSYLLTTTISDELRLATNLRSKVIGIALKDRGAILPAGHSANAAYWFESSSGNWISSTWYLKSLPTWVNDFNNKMLAQKMIQVPWNTLRPIAEYTESTADDSPYEDTFTGETKPIFPHNLQGREPGNYELIKFSPYGNILTKDFAIAALKGEQLGKDEFTDILAVSFSSPDYIGHQFGTHAIETEDNYLRLDLDLADLIKEIESYVGKENVIFFLTADHAAIPNVKFLIDQKIPAGIFNVAGTSDTLQKYLSKKYGAKKWVLEFDNDQVYFDHNLLEENNIAIKDIAEITKTFLTQIKGVSSVLTSAELATNEYTYGIKSYVQRGFYQKRSGDVVMILEPGLIEYKLKGTTHGSGYTYDTHVPLLFYGWKIKSGETSGLTDVIDIAPTLSQILGIQPPNGATGKVIEKVLQLK